MRCENFHSVWEKEACPQVARLHCFGQLRIGVNSRDVNRSSGSNKKFLVTAIKEVLANMSKDDAIKDCGRFRSRLEQVVEARNDFNR